MNVSPVATPHDPGGRRPRGGRPRRWIRWGMGLGLGLGGILLGGLILLRHPGLVFPHAIAHGGLILRSDHPLDPEAGRAVLETVRRSLGHPFPEGEGLEAAICIANTRWRRLLYFLPDRRAVGLSYPVTPHVFLSGADVARNRVVAPDGQEALPYFSLVHTAAHELGHVLSFRRFGSRSVLLEMPEWLREGLAEATTEVEDAAAEARWFAEEGSRQLLEPQRLPPYRSYRFLVNGLLAQGWRLEQLAASRMSVREAMTRVLDAGPHAGPAAQGDGASP